MAQPGVSNFGQAMNQIAVGLAQQKWQMEQARQAMAMKQAEMASEMMHQRAQEALYGAEIKGHNAQSEHYQAQANDLNQKQQAAGMFGDVIEGMNKYPATQPDLMPIALGQAARLAGQGQQHVPVNMAQILQMQNPQMQQIMAAGGANKLYNNVPAGATAVSPVSGVPTVMGGVTLPEGANYFGPQTIDFHQLLNGQLPQKQQTAQGGPKQFAPNTGHPAQAAALNAIAGHQISLQRLGPDFFNAVQNIATNTAPYQRTGPIQPQSIPDKGHAAQEATQLIGQYPDKAPAIRKRYFDTYGEQLP